MHESLRSVTQGRRLVLVVAAPAEAIAARRATTSGDPTAPPPWSRSALARDIDLIVTGIGKSNAAGACARLLDPRTDGAVLNLGVAGTLQDGPPLLASVAASRSVFADEGLETPEGFLDCDEMGFPLGDFRGAAPPTDPRLLECCRDLTDLARAVATVSTCSGTDGAAAQVARRTGAAAEAMEGAAVLLIAHRLGLPAAEVRLISNTTGDRSRQRWDLAGALARLSSVIGRIAAPSNRA